MRLSRLTLSLGLLLSAVSSLRADFMVVRVIVNPEATSRGTPALAATLFGNPPSPGGPGAMPGPGMMPGPGAMPGPNGPRPGGPGMTPGGPGGPGGMMPGPGPRPGGPGGPGMMPGGPGMMPGGPGMMPGGPGMMPGGATPGGTGGGATTEATTIKLRPDDYVIAVIPIKKSFTYANKDTYVSHQWSRTGELSAKVYKNSEILVSPIKLAAPKKLYAQRMVKYPEKVRDVNWYHLTATWCLEHGLTDECEKSLDLMVKLIAEKKGGTPDAVTAAADLAWTKLKDEINLESPKTDTFKKWKEATGFNSAKKGTHFAILYDGGNDLLEESVKRRLNYLEQNFRTFYMLNALQGRALKLPDQMQVAVVARDSAGFGEQRISSDNTDALYADGFYAQRDNVIFFSPRRIDEPWLNFAQQTKPLFEKYGYTNLLSGRPLYDNKKKWDEVAKEEIWRGQMYAMVQQALEEEAESAAATQEGTRQLYIASGLLPKAVYLPGWLKFGLSAQQEVTKAPFPTDSMSKVAFWPSAGGASWSWMRYFEDIKTTKRIGTPVQALMDTLAGKTFSDAAIGVEPNPLILFKRGNKMKPEDEAYFKQHGRYSAEARAKTLSWALVWYLTRNHPTELYTFFSELSALPRDLEADEGVLTLMFARSFKLTKESPAGDIPDELLMTKFADGWIRWMTRQNSPTTDLKLEDAAIQGFGEAPPGPGGPGGPEGGPPEGGPPGGPGGPGGAPGGAGGGGSPSAPG